MSTENLFIGIPAYSGIQGSSFLSHLEVIRDLTSSKMAFQYFIAENCGDIVMTRNAILRAFLASPCTHLLMVDSDVQFPPGVVYEMLQYTSEDEDVEFIGGAVPMRVMSTCSVCTSAVRFNVDLLDDSPAEYDLLELRAIGAAFVMVTRNVIDKMAAAYPELEHVDSRGQTTPGLFNHFIEPESRRQYGEDISFCARWSALGGKIWCITDCELTHTGPIRLSGKLEDVHTHMAVHTQLAAGAA